MRIFLHGCELVATASAAAPAAPAASAAVSAAAEAAAAAAAFASAFSRGSAHVVVVVLACGRRNDDACGLSSGGSVLSSALGRLATVVVCIAYKLAASRVVANGTLWHGCRPLASAEPATLLMTPCGTSKYQAC